MKAWMAIVRLKFDGGVLRERGEVNAKAPIEREGERELRSLHSIGEADDCVDSVAGQPAVGHDVRFFSLDLTNTCWIRSFYGGRGTVLDAPLGESGRLYPFNMIAVPKHRI